LLLQLAIEVLHVAAQRREARQRVGRGGGHGGIALILHGHRTQHVQRRIAQALAVDRRHLRLAQRVQLRREGARGRQGEGGGHDEGLGDAAGFHTRLRRLGRLRPEPVTIRAALALDIDRQPRPMSRARVGGEN